MKLTIQILIFTTFIYLTILILLPLADDPAMNCTMNISQFTYLRQSWIIISRIAWCCGGLCCIIIAFVTPLFIDKITKTYNYVTFKNNTN